MEEYAAPPASPINIELGVYEYDHDYEFDAPRYFDFSSSESQLDIDVAESWFRSASSCPPSPFVIELMWNEGQKAPDLVASSGFEEMPSSNSGWVSTNGLSSLKSEVKKKISVWKGSTLMKPTASHLAKLNARKQVSKSVRPQTHSVMNNEKNHQNQATKRQKLESGYLRKVAHLNHQTVFAHKKTTEVAQLSKKSLDPKRVTVPREPMLETARRALIRSSRRKGIVEHDRDAESTTHTFKARPLNKKILQNPSVPLRKKTTPVFPEFQELHLKTSGHALQQPSENVLSMPESISISHTGSILSERSSYVNSPTQGNKAATNIEFQTVQEKEILSSMSKKTSQVPPTELFSKLSLISEGHLESSKSKLLKTTQVLKSK